MHIRHCVNKASCDPLNCHLKILHCCLIGGNSIGCPFPLSLTFSFILSSAVSYCLLYLCCCCVNKPIVLPYTSNLQLPPLKLLTLDTLITWENWIASLPSDLSYWEMLFPLCETLMQEKRRSHCTLCIEHETGTALGVTLYGEKKQ